MHHSMLPFNNYLMHEIMEFWQREADIRVAWPVYVRTYCVPIATLNQNKRTRLLYLGDTQIIRFKPRIKLNRDMYIYFFTQIGLVA